MCRNEMSFCIPELVTPPDDTWEQVSRVSKFGSQFPVRSIGGCVVDGVRQLLIAVEDRGKFFRAELTGWLLAGDLE